MEMGALRASVRMRSVAALSALFFFGSAWAASVSYTYDELGRLKSASYGAGVYTNYGLDATGNRTVVTSGTDSIAPTAPSGVTAVATSSTKVTIAWTASSDSGGSGLTGYQIFRGGILVGTSTSPAFVDASTLGTTAYSYTIKAVDAAGNVSAASAAATVTTPDTLAPSVPTALSLTTATSTTVTLSWGASTDTGGSGLAGYRVYRNGVQIGTTTGLTLTDSTVTGWVTYGYTVAAYDNAGNVSVPSGILSVKVPDTIAPTVPTGLTPTAANANEVDLTWTASTDNGSGVAGYKVYRGGTLLASVAGGPGYIDYALAGGAIVTYTVSAQDNAGNSSAQSTAASVTTPAGVPPAPIETISPAPIAYGGNFTVSWTSYPGVSTFQLYQATGTGTFTLNYSGSALYKVFSGKPTGDYSYYVLACNASGCSVQSETLTVTSCPTSGCP
jgi:chitodextrinase